MIIIKNWFPSRLQSNFKQIKLSHVKTILEKLSICSNLDPQTVIGVYIANPRQIAQLSKFKGKRHSTDTLSFPYHNPSNCELQVDEGEAGESEDRWCLGEIVLCPERIIRGRSGNLAQNIRLREVIVHSFVHLLGYDHNTLPEYRQMRFIEKSLLNQLSRKLGNELEQQPLPQISTKFG
jgi:rRNA maturation RNase YbeY